MEELLNGIILSSPELARNCLPDDSLSLELQWPANRDVGFGRLRLVWWIQVERGNSRRGLSLSKSWLLCQ